MGEATICCGDIVCEGGEDGFSCELDCGSPPSCGDDNCDPGEGICTCSADCGAPPVQGLACDNEVDDDCDLQSDCDDADCAEEPACSCQPLGASCNAASDCCSNKCKGRSAAQVCK